MDETRTAARMKSSWEGIPRGPRRTRNTLFWAALVPVAATVGGFLSQYPYGMLYVGVLVVLAAAGLGAGVAGSNWNRAGAAIIVGFGTLALGVFAGSNLYESYAKLLGERVDAVVVDAGERTNSKGDVRHVCHVVDSAGESAELGDIQNCHGDFAEGRRVVLFKDPLGGLEPWIEATDDRSLDPVGLGITGGAFVLVGGTMFSAGMRRRSQQDRLEEHRRKHGPPWRSRP
ncbi:hypothetical protein M5362_12515 [Streptomyces sp. Je 1-79]|uniref:hypothetical protein n=1 Tax=Streptomyces sp. Je 1-79 TaxID=2943847 RepID=UPI0021A7915D|nr:hypothetical protein [Streptomyces sp. Je 1-79]MCT4353952.1 hypothetical protein [Streptomyces sp. Je 1-79]